jgi:AcrR family transcriptional regulator
MVRRMGVHAPESRRLSADERRERVLVAARTVFARSGFHGAGTAEIAALAGCSEPTLYKHFASKQALFAAALRDATDRMAARVQEIVAGAPDPLAALGAVAEQAAANPAVVEIVRLRMLAVTLVEDPDIRDALESSAERMRRCITSVIERGQRSGAVRGDVEAGAVALLWIGYTFAAGYRHAMDGSFPEAPAVAGALITMLRGRAEGEECG